MGRRNRKVLIDDMALLVNDKQTLPRWRGAIIDYLALLRLVRPTERVRPRPVEDGIPFLRFVVFPDDHRRLKRHTMVACRCHLKQLWAAYQAHQIGWSCSSWGR